MVQEFCPGIGMFRARCPQARFRPSHVSKQVARLHGGDDFQFAKTHHLCRIRDLRMLDTQTIVLGSIWSFYLCRARSLLGFIKCFEGHLHAFISDGVKTKLKSCDCTFFGHLIQLGLFILR